MIACYLSFLPKSLLHKNILKPRVLNSNANKKKRDEKIHNTWKQHKLAYNNLKGQP